MPLAAHTDGAVSGVCSTCFGPLCSGKSCWRQMTGVGCELVQRRFVSMAQLHLMALETTFTARGWSASVRIRSGVDTSVTNENVPEDALLSHHHLAVLEVSGPAEPTPVIEIERAKAMFGSRQRYRPRFPDRQAAAPPVRKRDFITALLKSRGPTPCRWW